MEQVMRVMTVLLAGVGALALVGGMAASLAPTTDEYRSRVMLMANQQMSQNLKSNPNPTPAQSIRLVLGGRQDVTHD
jgi:Tfp pilus assembly protein PilV